MPRADTFAVPDAIWDIPSKNCIDPSTHAPLPNYSGLCLLAKPLPMVMNTWLEGSERKWQFVCMGWNAPYRVLEEVLTKAS